MTLKIAKWGDGLAILIPATYARQLHLNVGDRVQASLTVDGGICIRRNPWDRRAFARELEAMRAAMPMVESVIGELRRGARY